MNKVHAYVRQFLEQNKRAGSEINGEPGWFSTRQIQDALADKFDDKIWPKAVANTVYLMRKNGEIETIKGSLEHPYQGMHRFVARPERPNSIGTVGVEGPQWHKRRKEQHRARRLAKGLAVRDPNKSKPVARVTVKVVHRVNALHPAGLMSIAPAQAPAPKPKAETVEEFRARGGQIDVLPGVGSRPFLTVPAR